MRPDDETHDAKPYIDAAIEKLGVDPADHPRLAGYLFAALYKHQVRDELPPSDRASPAEIVEQLERIADAAHEIDDALTNLSLQARSAISEGGARRSHLVAAYAALFHAACSAIPEKPTYLREHGFADFGNRARELAKGVDIEALKRPKRRRPVQVVASVKMLASAYEAVTGKRATANPGHEGPFVRFVNQLWLAVDRRPLSPKRVHEALSDDRVAVDTFNGDDSRH